MTYTLRIVEPGQRQRSVTVQSGSDVRMVREAAGMAQSLAQGTRIEVVESRGWFRADRLVGKVERKL